MSTSGKDEHGGYSRKEFLKRLSMGFGAAMAFPGYASLRRLTEFQRLSSLPELPDDKKLNYALVGLGYYATNLLAPALQETKLCKLNGIVTGTPSKAVRWKKKYGIPDKNIYNYDNYDQIANNPDIDVIYIVLPNSMHAEYTIRGAEAGKHMISEKPMATSVKDAQAMVDACKKNNRKFSVGYRLHFEPHNKRMMELGQKEVFGPVQSIKGENGFHIADDPTKWRLDKQMAGGGPLMDMGIYVVQGAIYTMGKLPLSVTARTEVNHPKKFDEVEENIYWKMEFPDGVIADCESSYARGMSNIRANARDGYFKLEPAFGYGGLKGETSKGPMNLPNVNQQALQMDAFADCIMNDRESRVPGIMGLRDVKILMAIYEAAKKGEKVKLDLDPRTLDRVEDWS